MRAPASREQRDLGGRRQPRRALEKALREHAVQLEIDAYGVGIGLVLGPRVRRSTHELAEVGSSAPSITVSRSTTQSASPRSASNSRLLSLQSLWTTRAGGAPSSTASAIFCAAACAASISRPTCPARPAASRATAAASARAPAVEIVEAGDRGAKRRRRQIAQRGAEAAEGARRLERLRRVRRPLVRHGALDEGKAAPEASRGVDVPRPPVPRAQQAEHAALGLGHTLLLEAPALVLRHAEQVLHHPLGVAEHVRVDALQHVAGGDAPGLAAEDEGVVDVAALQGLAARRAPFQTKRRGELRGPCRSPVRHGRGG